MEGGIVMGTSGTRNLLRQCLWAAALAAMLFQVAPAAAQGGRFITLVVPFAAGDSPDATARVLADELSRQLQQNVVVENRVGASGDLAAQRVIAAEPDGHTFLFSTTGIVTFLPTLRKVGYDPDKLVAVGKVADAATIFAVSENVPAKSFAEFVALAKSQPGKFTFASSGEGTVLHLRGESIKRKFGIDLLHVPYRGMAPAVTDFVAGRLDVMLEQSVIPSTHAGHGRVLMVMSPARLKEVPNVPTATELSLSIDGGVWFGIFAPPRTPPEIIARVSKAIEAAVKTEAFTGRLPIGVIPNYAAPEPFAAEVARDRDVYVGIIKDIGLKVQQ
jgi:tripartite-type tricarboxylate transporter receptor subunit TctC